MSNISSLNNSEKMRASVKNEYYDVYRDWHTPPNGNTITFGYLDLNFQDQTF